MEILDWLGWNLSWGSSFLFMKFPTSSKHLKISQSETSKKAFKISCNIFQILNTARKKCLLDFQNWILRTKYQNDDKNSNRKISRYLRKGKRKRKPDTNNKNIQAGYGNGIWHWKTGHALNEQWEKRNNRRNGTRQSGKHQNSLGKRKLQVISNIGSGNH